MNTKVMLKEDRQAAGQGMKIQEVFDLIHDDVKEMEDGFKQSLNSHVQLVSKVGEYILNSGGKRFRPMVFLLVARLCKYRGDRHIPLAGVIEFIHTATLLHDDVVDNAALRRGSKSANIVWGNGASVLVGDYILSKAFAVAIANADMNVLNVLSQTTTSMAEGEVLQLAKHNDLTMSEQEYLDIVTNKTGVLLSAAARIAAIISDVTYEKEVALINYGLDLGIAYQLMDDSLDYISNDEDLGKGVGNDLREGKVTMPLIHAFRNAAEAERKLLKEAIEDSELTDGRLASVLEIIHKYKGIEYTVQRATKHIEDAKQSLTSFDSSINKTALMTVADFVIERKY